MRNSRSTVMGFAFAASVCVVGSVAFAHSTGNERRNEAQCKALDPTKYPGQIKPCIICVTGKCATGDNPSGKCHYHPDDPPGTRCRPDNGKP